LSIEDYGREIGEGRPPIAKGIAFSAEDRLRGDIIERLMCDLKVDVSVVKARHGLIEIVFDDEFTRLAPLVDDGIITIDNDRITITDLGRPFVRLVAAAFDSYLQSGKGRHSKAV
jgi:oxygen-independent coproporphyrinogen III oxidase